MTLRDMNNIVKMIEDGKSIKFISELLDIDEDEIKLFINSDKYKSMKYNVNIDREICIKREDIPNNVIRHKTVDKAEDIIDRISGLEALNIKLQNVATKLINVTSNKLDEELNTQDLERIANIVTKVYGAFNNPNITNILIQNNNMNNDNNQRLEIFKKNLKA